MRYFFVGCLELTFTEARKQLSNNLTSYSLRDPGN